MRVAIHHWLQVFTMYPIPLTDRTPLALIVLSSDLASSPLSKLSCSIPSSLPNPSTSTHHRYLKVHSYSLMNPIYSTMPLRPDSPCLPLLSISLQPFQTIPSFPLSTISLVTPSSPFPPTPKCSPRMPKLLSSFSALSLNQGILTCSI